MAGDFHVLVALPPGYGLLRQQAVDLIKAGVLYGDTVTVVMHLSTHMVTGLLVGAPPHERAAFLRRCMKPVHIARAGFPVDDTMPGSNNDLGTRLQRMVNDFSELTSSGAVQLELVMEDKVYETLTLEHDEPALAVRIDPGIELYARTTAELLAKSPMSYPLFAASRVADVLGEARTSPASISRASQATVASAMLHRLPTFSRASLSDTIYIRRGLEAPLLRYRAAVAELVSEDASDDHQSVADQAESVWIETVAPALLEIHELVRQNSYIRRLADHLIAKPDGLVGIAGIAASLATLDSVPQFLAAGIGALLPSMRAAWSKYQTRESLSRDRLYLLYQVNQAMKTLV